MTYGGHIVSIRETQSYNWLEGNNDSHIIVGKQNDYIFAVVYPWNNTEDNDTGLKSQGFMHTGLYTNDSKQNAIYLLPELSIDYSILISQDGSDVWLIAEQGLNCYLPEDLNMSLPIISYYKNGERIYQMNLSDLYDYKEFLSFQHGGSIEYVWCRNVEVFDNQIKINRWCKGDDGFDDIIPVYIDRYKGNSNNIFLNIFLTIAFISIICISLLVFLKSKKRNQ